MFLNDWSESGVDGLKHDFKINDDAIAGAEILLASYTYENYLGVAFVLFRKDGKLFEVNGGHCSCDSLENQWEPEETDVDVLLHRLKHDKYQFNGMRDELRQVLAGLSN